MPNFIQCVGYALGKVHTGMLCYLFERYNEGEREAVGNLFAALGCSPLPNRLKYKREWKGIDLVVFDAESGAPFCMVELKVDDHEHVARGTDKYQTEVYPTFFPTCKNRFFVTLGSGEYYSGPKGSEFRWVQIREFYNCLRSINLPDALIQSWIDAIRQEINLQDFAMSGDMSCREKYRTGTWNIYFYGGLKKALFAEPFSGTENIKATAYMYGTRPDTILNFGWRENLYMEINNNGKLNLKATIDSLTDEEKQVFTRQADELKKTFLEFAPDLSTRVPRAGSHTILSFDVGLKEIARGTLGYKGTSADTVSRLREILSIFYGKHS